MGNHRPPQVFMQTHPISWQIKAILVYRCLIVINRFNLNKSTWSQTKSKGNK